MCIDSIIYDMTKCDSCDIYDNNTSFRPYEITSPKLISATIFQQKMQYTLSQSYYLNIIRLCVLS